MVSKMSTDRRDNKPLNNWHVFFCDVKEEIFFEKIDVKGLIS